MGNKYIWQIVEFEAKNHTAKVLVGTYWENGINEKVMELSKSTALTLFCLCENVMVETPEEIKINSVSEILGKYSEEEVKEKHGNYAVMRFDLEKKA